tara:strand:+ start:82 stop:528 length:447 start_codon:yes stop_codon:yes gene_type:complete
MTISYSFVLDMILISSLFITIFCCLFLYNKLRDIRKSENEIRKIVSEFTAATERANTSLLTLKSSSSDLTSFMQDKILEAKSVIDDLKFLNEQGSKISNKYEGTKNILNDYKKEKKRFNINRAEDLTSSVSIRSEMEKELISALEQSR